MSGHLISRERLLERMRPVYDSDIIKVLMGPKGSGKSTVLRMIADEIEADDGHKIFIDFDDRRNDGLRTASALNDRVSGLMKEGRYYLFLDEVQNVEDCPRVLASLMSTGMCSIFVTGSSSKLLSGEHASSLTGRTLSFEVLPFSYSEAKEYVIASTGSVPDGFLVDYIRFGGYPQRLQANGEEETRRSLEKQYRWILVNGIHGGLLGLDMKKFEKVAAYVMANCGKHISAESVAEHITKTDGINVSIQTVYNYLDLMEEAYILKRVEIYNICKKTVLSNLPANYALDNGIRHILAGDADLRNGSILENLVYLELLGRGYKVYAGKNHDTTIDFIAMREGRKCFIQVAYLMTDDAALEKEFGTLYSVMDASPKYVISMDPIDMSRDGIIHLNLTDFLEGRKDLFLS